jgi:protein-disulfide isomerase
MAGERAQPSKVLRKAAGLVVDALTIFILGICLWVALRPGSPVRLAWDNHRATVTTREAAARIWSRMVTVATPLYDGGDPPVAIEVSDYECPFCRRAAPLIDSALAVGARIAYIHMPRPSSSSGMAAARAGVCAASVGQFRKMHAYLMRTVEWQTSPDWVRDAQSAGIQKVDAFEECLRSEESLARLGAHRAFAVSLSVTATPTFVTQHKVIRGVADVEALLALGLER